MQKLILEKREHLSFDVECFVLCSSRGEIEGLVGNTESVVRHALNLLILKEHYCYICVKKNGADKLCEQNWDLV